ncbi:MAG: exodeoxyribonuclease III [Pseudomonadota bacterium]
MAITIATWNINSVRLRAPLVERLLTEEAPDVLCLQECKCMETQFPYDTFAALGWSHAVVRGEKSYNGVAIISRLPIEDAGFRDVLGKGDTRHVAARLPSGETIHNFYIPAGGDKPDREKNDKFGHKLDFLTDLTEWFRAEPPEKSILVGDLNIAPREYDVWNHKQLLKVVSHTPIETEMMAEMLAAGNWVDITRQDIPEGLLYSWWSYRSPDWDKADKGRRLDHIWATPDLAPRMGCSRILREARGWEKPSDHAPVFATLDTA